MNKKAVTLIFVILISFCFISIAVADNATPDDNNTTHKDKHDKKQTKEKNTTVKNKTTEDNKTDDNKTEDKSGNYILAMGSGNNIRFSDGFIGFILDYSKPAAKSGDKYKHASASKAGNSNLLK